MASLHNIFGNDVESDCVIAARYHLKGVHTGNAGALFVPTMDQINADYAAIGGYVAGQPATDQGCDEVTAIDYWTTTGDCTGVKFAGAVEVDACNWPEVQSGLFLFEGALCCLELPGDYTTNMPTSDSSLWDVAGDPNPDDGHGVMLAGYGKGPNGSIGGRPSGGLRCG